MSFMELLETGKTLDVELASFVQPVLFRDGDPELLVGSAKLCREVHVRSIARGRFEQVNRLSQVVFGLLQSTCLFPGDP